MSMADFERHEVYRFAFLLMLMSEHKAEAVQCAADRAREAAMRGDYGSATFYVRVVKAIGELARHHPFGTTPRG